MAYGNPQPSYMAHAATAFGQYQTSMPSVNHVNSGPRRHSAGSSSALTPLTSSHRPLMRGSAGEARPRRLDFTWEGRQGGFSPVTKRLWRQRNGISRPA